MPVRRYVVLESAIRFSLDDHDPLTLTPTLKDLLRTSRSPQKSAVHQLTKAPERVSEHVMICIISIG